MSVRDLLADVGFVCAPDGLMARTVARIRRAALTPRNGLFLGENGTGKSKAASLTHLWSARREGPLHIRPCGRVDGMLGITELSGHEPHAYTDSGRGSPGLIEMAHGGTLTFDDLDKMPRDEFTRLLDFFDRGEVIRIGGKVRRRVDVRILATSNRRRAEFESGVAIPRELYERLDPTVIELPALCDRPEDIEPLVRAMLPGAVRGAGIGMLEVTAEALRLLEEYPWPGNVRQLGRMIQDLAMEHPPAGRIDHGLVRCLLDAMAPVAGRDADALERSESALRELRRIRRKGADAEKDRVAALLRSMPDDLRRSRFLVGEADARLGWPMRRLASALRLPYATVWRCLRGDAGRGDSTRLTSSARPGSG